jgi:pyrroloquinoline quinone biosynthesis protein D
MKIFRNADAQWREEELSREHVEKALAAGEDASAVGTSLILFHGNMHALNILGTEIWKLCDGRTREELVHALEEVFDADPETLRRDVEAFLSELKGLGLIYEQ